MKQGTSQVATPNMHTLHIKDSIYTKHRTNQATKAAQSLMLKHPLKFLKALFFDFLGHLFERLEPGRSLEAP